MARIGISQHAVGGTYMQALRPKGSEPTFSIKDNLWQKLHRDMYERSSVQRRWASFQGGEGWSGASGASMGQPYAPWQPFRRA